MQNYIEWCVADMNGDYSYHANRNEARQEKRELKSNGLDVKIIRREYQMVNEQEVR